MAIIIHPGSIAGTVPRPFRDRPAAVGRGVGRGLRWTLSHPEVFLVLGILIVVGAAHGINMFHFPYGEDDEGTYMSQAASIVRDGRLAPYTYWYDHAPVGWMQIAIWSVATGGFHTFGTSIDGGRVFMWALALASTLMVYLIGRRVSGSMLVGTVASLLFSLTAYGGYFQRRVLLDNITVPWMLLSVLILVAPRPTLLKIFLSAGALAISILSKEVTAFLVPAMTYLVWTRAAPGQRAFAMVGWVVLGSSVVLMYVLMAAINHELFPMGTWLGGTNDHVSLLGSLQYQASRSKDSGILSQRSAFWLVAHGWIRDEPLLVVGGTASAVVGALLIRWHRTVGIIGLLTLSLWLFMARGGEVIEFYLVPLLPLLALNIALLLGVASATVAALVRVPSRRLRIVGILARGACATAIVAGLLLGYMSPDRGFATTHTLLWTSTQADAQQQALAWIGQHVDDRSKVVMDNYAYEDLHDGSMYHRVFPGSDYYWKVDADKAILTKVYHNRWQYADLVVYTIQIQTDVRLASLPLTKAIVAHSVLLAHFDTGGWPVDIRKVVKPGAKAPDTLLPVQNEAYFTGGLSAGHVASVISLLNPNTLPASARLTFYFQDGTVTHAGVVVDASSRRVLVASSIQAHAGPFGLLIQTDRPIVSYLLRTDPSGRATMGDGVLLASSWALRWDTPSHPFWRSFSILNPDATRRVRLQVASLGPDGSTRSRTPISLGPHSLYILDLSLPGRAGIRVSADTPVAVQDTTSAHPGDETRMTSVIAGRPYVIVTSNLCRGIVAGAIGNDPARLIVAHCPSEVQMRRFIGGTIHPLVGHQHLINQTEFPGSLGNETTGAVRFGEGPNPMP